MLELKGELVFKTVAYHRAADAIGRSPVDIVSAYRAGHATADPGRRQGDQRQDRASSRRPATSRSTTGSGRRCRPASSSSCRSPGSARRPSASSTRSSGSRPSTTCGSAAESGRLRSVRGMSARTEALVLEGIARLDERFDRMLLDRAEELVDGPHRRPVARRPASGRSSRPARSAAAGSRSATSTCSPRPTEPAALIDAFTAFGLVDSVINRGGHKAAVRLHARAAGGPDGHAARRGGHVPHPLHRLQGAQRPAPGDGPRPRLEPVREGLPAHRRGRRAADRRRRRAPDLRRPRPRPTPSSACPFIEPELREDAGEIEAALAGRLPALVEQADLRGDLHSHSDWSDGHQPIEVMAEAARRRGYAYQVLTDHTQSLADRPRPDPGPGRRAGRDHRRAQRPVRGRGGRRDGAARDPGRGLPPAARLRAGDPRRRDARLRGRPARPVRPRRRVGPRRPSPDAGRADPAHAQRHPQPARRRHRPSVGPEDRRARRPRPRLGRDLHGGGPDRDRARDERLAAAPRPRGRAGAPGGRSRLPASPSTRMPTTSTSSTTSAGGSARRAGRGSPRTSVVNTRSRADLLAWVGRQAGAMVR